MNRSCVLTLMLVIGAGCRDDISRPELAPSDKPSASTAIAPSAASGDTDYVRTPAGLVHKSCVLGVARGERVERNGSIRRQDGSTFSPAPCRFPGYPNIPENLAAGRGRSHRPDVAEPVMGSGPSHSWIQYVASTIAGPYMGLEAEWTVPNSPITFMSSAWTHGQTYFTFPGLQSPSYIMQPVLQYGSNGWFGGEYWTIANWWCDGNGTWCYYSQPQVVATGDRLRGTITSDSCDGTQCRYLISVTDLTNNAFSLLGFWDAPNYTQLISGAVEQWNLPMCQDLAGQTPDFRTSGVFYSGVTVYDASHNQTLPAVFAQTPGAGYAPFSSCRLRTGLSATTADLLFSNPFSASITGPTALNRYQSGQYVARPIWGDGPFTYEWRTRRSQWSPYSGYNWTSWSPWYSTGSTDNTFVSQSGCGVNRIDLEVMITDGGNNGYNSTATNEYYISINNPC
jgi:hypothetical protein